MRLAVVAALCLSMVGLAVAADAKAAMTKMPTNIPAQGLGPALKTLAKDRGFQVVFRSEVVGSARTQGALGSLTTPEALTELLKGTNLAYSYLDENTVTIIPRDSSGPADSPSSDQTQPSSKPKEGKNDSSQDFRVAQVDKGTPPSGSSVTQQTEQSSENKSTPLEEIVVTGTHIRGTGQPVGAHLLTITAEDIAEGGFVTAQDAVRSLPQNFTGTVSDNMPTALVANGAGAREGVQNYSAAAALDLRGLGADSTLVLVNGHRLSPGGGLASFVDVSSIPMAAIDHIEVLPDGASAIYGADAIGGVVNFVLKRDYSGADTTLQFGHVTAGGLSDANFGQTFGTTWDSGSAFLAVGLRNRTALTADERPQETASDLTSRGGTNFSLGYCNPGTLFDVNGQSYAIPAGQNGMHLAPSSLIPGTQANCSNLNDGDLYPSQRQYNLYTYIDQKLTDTVKVYADISFANRRDTQTSSNTGYLTVPNSNPFYVNPAGTTDPVNVEYDFLRDLGPARNDGDTKTLNVTAGLTWSIAADWTAEISASEALQRLDFRALGTESSDQLNAVLSDPNPSTAFNPFGDGSFTNPNTLALLESTRQTERFTSSSTVQSADVTSSGSLFLLPAGEVKAAIGGEFRKEIYSTNDFQTNYQLDAAGSSIVPVVAPVAAEYSRNIGAIFAEATLPFVSDQNAMPAVKSLDLSIAGRFEHYSDFGSTSVPRIGLRWKPLDSIALRGSWSRSFRAPDLPDLSEAQNKVLIAKLPDPSSPTGFSNVLYVGGGNADLKPETANIWSAGFDIAPSQVPFTLSATYFHIRFNDRISGLPSRNYFFDPADAFAITRNPTAAEQAAACSNGFFQGNFSSAPGTCTNAPIDAIIDGRTHNETSVRQDGIDLTAKYPLVTAFGKYEVGINATHLFAYPQQPTPTSGTFELLDTPYYPLATRLRGSAGWSLGGYSATAFYNYAGSYTDTTSVPSRSISSWSTVDVNLAYRFAKDSGFLSNSQIAINVQNLFDRAPPFYNNPLGIAYDPVNADPLGRFLLLSVRKSW